eukprot:m.23488 g.23488  ORF g.23488 m.23488 type:complete len:226 (-) comp8986_c0_seq1:653-1330(-)
MAIKLTQLQITHDKLLETHLLYVYVYITGPCNGVVCSSFEPQEEPGVPDPSSFVNDDGDTRELQLQLTTQQHNSIQSPQAELTLCRTMKSDQREKGKFLDVWTQRDSIGLLGTVAQTFHLDNKSLRDISCRRCHQTQFEQTPTGTEYMWSVLRWVGMFLLGIKYIGTAQACFGMSLLDTLYTRCNMFLSCQESLIRCTCDRTGIKRDRSALLDPNKIPSCSPHTK